MLTAQQYEERNKLAREVREALEVLQPPDDLPRWAERMTIIDHGAAMTDLEVHHDSAQDDDAEHTMGNVDVLVAAVQNPYGGPVQWADLEDEHPKAFNRLAWLILLGVANLHIHRFDIPPEPRRGRCLCPGGADRWERETIATWMGIAKPLLGTKAGRGEIEGLLGTVLKGSKTASTMSKHDIESSNSEPRNHGLRTEEKAAAEGRQSAKPPRTPTEQERQCYNLHGLGWKQADIAERVFGDAGKQGQVSRAIKAVKAYHAAGGLNVDDVLGGNQQPSAPVSVDPTTLETGERKDGRTKRQRDRRAVNQ